VPILSAELQGFRIDGLVGCFYGDGFHPQKYTQPINSAKSPLFKKIIPKPGRQTGLGVETFKDRC
jgi:hypothetical protein